MTAPVSVSAPLGKRPLRTLFTYLWRKDWDSRIRIIIGVLLLVLGKLANVYAPIFYKHAVDALTLTADHLVTLVPVGLILSYGLARVGSMAFSELREALFGKVLFGTMRAAAIDVFRHLHQLSLRFHLERRTGGLSRVIERGIAGIERFLSLTTWFLGPTLLEIVMT